MSTLQHPPFVLGFPTETVYGLAARIDEPRGIEAIFKWKERPFFDPLIVHISNFSQLSLVVSSWPKAAEILAKEFWPGPLTLVLPKHPGLNSMITSGLETVGVRWPKHPMALEIINEEAMPLAAPSANKFGRTSPTTAEHVRQEFGQGLPIRDGGACEVGLESTVLRVHEVQGKITLSLLRPGAVTETQIESALVRGELSDYRWEANLEKSLAPGQMKHHYMPPKPLILIKNKALSEPAILSLIEQRFAELPEVVESVKMLRPQFPVSRIEYLQLSSDPILAAREFYANLRRAGESEAQLIFFVEEAFHRNPEWKALWDRLTKAASLVV